MDEQQIDEAIRQVMASIWEMLHSLHDRLTLLERQVWNAPCRICFQPRGVHCPGQVDAHDFQ